MSIVPIPTPLMTGDEQLVSEVLAHLDAQLISARRLHGIVLEQASAIRDRAVHAVVALAGLMQAELERRALLDRNRGQLLQRAGERLQRDPATITLEQLCPLMEEATARSARERSAELRGILREIRRIHDVNRGLMTQQLAFLDHLLQLANVHEPLGYSALGDRRHSPARMTTPHRLLDFEV